ncbi:MAG TPA: ModE family transcriptional regulator [Sphingomonadaceae bacterium]|nr:ModE family transcriptional regulator [Sphingomonadaceae bacterium]
MANDRRLKITPRLYCGEEIAMGPGKAALLEAIVRTGSISAAGRALGMSYRRTWLLVDVMNRCWAEPLVATATGGSHGGGATVTPFGREVLAAYRCWQAQLAAADGETDALLAKLAPEPRPSQGG